MKDETCDLWLRSSRRKDAEKLTLTETPRQCRLDHVGCETSNLELFPISAAYRRRNDHPYERVRHQQPICIEIVFEILMISHRFCYLSKNSMHTCH